MRRSRHQDHPPVRRTTGRYRNFLAALAIPFVLAATSLTAVADNLVVDGDNATPVSGNTLNFGTVCVGSTTTNDALLAVNRNGNGHVFANGATVSVGLDPDSTPTSGLSASMSDASIVLPGNWATLGNNTVSTDTATSAITLVVGSTTGPLSGTVNFLATGRNTAGVTISRDKTLNVSATVSNTGSCAPAPADTTPPIVTLSLPTPPADHNGWFNAMDQTPVPGSVTASDASNVSAIDCTDSAGGLTLGALSGSGTDTASRSISIASDGTHNISCTATDAPGSTGAATGSISAATVKIDRRSPALTATAKTADLSVYTSGTWTNQAVTVSFACTDSTSGVTGTFPTSQTIAVETVGGSVSQGCSDRAGNSASATFSDIDIDKTLPVLTGAVTTPSSGTDASLVKWYNTDVNVHWTASDSPSGVDTATVPADSTVTGEGSNQGAGPVTVNDLAGNTGSGSISGIHIDRLGPTISPATFNADGTAYTPGTWTNQAVRVSYTCADLTLADRTNGSGVASCPTDELVNTDGADQSVTGGAAQDIAGNSTAGAAVADLDIDGQKPQTTATISCTGRNGYCRGTTASVILTASDQNGLSGVKEIHYSVDGGQERTASAATTTVTVPLAARSGEGTLEYFAVDNAGNAETKTGVTLRYDNLAPTVTHVVTPTPNTSGWNNTDLNVHFNAADDAGGSGVDPATVTPDISVTDETAGRIVTGQADDYAGNTGTDSVTVKLDETKPTITASIVPGTNTTLSTSGWYNGPVAVQFVCADPNAPNGSAGSGVASCPAAVTLTGDGANQRASGTAEDLAGNVSLLAAVSGINIDATAPVITITGLTQTMPYLLGAAPSLTCSATDATSDVIAAAGGGTCSGTITGGTANGVGTFTYTARATDLAGNTATETVTYRVIYRWDGFLQPINDTAHQVGLATSVFKAGSTVPVKFQVKRADGTVVQLPSLPLWLTPAKGGATSAAVDEALYGDLVTNGTAYRWDATAQQYIYNWGTAKNQAGFYWRIGARLDDGQTYYVNIGLR